MEKTVLEFTARDIVKLAAKIFVVKAIVGAAAIAINPRLRALVIESQSKRMNEDSK